MEVYDVRFHIWFFVDGSDGLRISHRYIMLTFFSRHYISYTSCPLGSRTCLSFFYRRKFPGRWSYTDPILNLVSELFPIWALFAAYGINYFFHFFFIKDSFSLIEEYLLVGKDLVVFFLAWFRINVFFWLFITNFYISVKILKFL